MISGVYFESWDEWKGRLKDLNKAYNTVYLSFADPKGKWNGGDWSGTGMQFHSSVDVVKEDIRELQGRGVTVMLSVGGASFPFQDGFDGTEMVKLANDLGCDGIDIDWEGGGNWVNIIHTFKMSQQKANGKCMKLSAAVWSTGCMQPVQGDQYRGMNIAGLVTHGSYFDWLNIMAYDCGPPSMISPNGSFYTYRVYYPGPLCMGFEVGKMGWGGYLTTQDDVKSAAGYTGADKLGDKNGYFIWSYRKADYANGVTHDYINETCKLLIGGERDVTMQCPW